MIGVSIQCRLGNQLFQYAFAKASAEKLNTSFFLIEGEEQFVLPKYFELEGYSKPLNIFRKIIYKIKNKSFFKSLQATEIQLSTTPVSDNNVYSGYFQSGLFFENIATKLATYIKVKPQYLSIFNKLYGELFDKDKVIAIHIRRGDYLNLDYWWLENLGSDNLSLPITYFEKCLAQIENVDSYKIIFTSDDIGYVKNVFGNFKNAIFAEHDMITDFQILMNANICILSNSSFSWWAAYLNRNQDKKVFCPKHWLGFKIQKEYPNDIIPKEWLQTKV
ncbi:alpha-1,2-fucosyltransferase [Pedobacter agri]|uniref:alpha-1,2-fucosyltransferase n=1 Tax=Pedobacter agri TaxID=454586 RepID=UPI002931B42A|nr:alpha-1,2-fucosyltransferase [Pedobacter agri]